MTQDLSTGSARSLGVCTADRFKRGRLRLTELIGDLIRECLFDCGVAVGMQ